MKAEDWIEIQNAPKGSRQLVIFRVQTGMSYTGYLMDDGVMLSTIGEVRDFGNTIPYSFVTHYSTIEQPIKSIFEHQLEKLINHTIKTYESRI